MTIIYSSPYRPDPTSALDVLAFLLTPEDLFIDDEMDREAVESVLYQAKVSALLHWYASRGE